jgi:hypothetical protein
MSDCFFSMMKSKVRLLMQFFFIVKNFSFFQLVSDLWDDAWVLYKCSHTKQTAIQVILVSTDDLHMNP